MNVIERFIFFPDSELIATPQNVSLAFEDVTFETTDGVRLHGWWVPGRREETFLWFHGNAGNISHRIDNLRHLHDHIGVGVLLFDYRQYGRSEGRASERGLYADARAARAYLAARADVRTDRIVYFGRSLGAAVATNLATEAGPWALILETPFTSTRDMAQRILPAALAGLIPAGFDNLGKVTSLSCPMLFIHGDRDDIVPYEQGQRLFAATGAPKDFLTIAGAGHNDTYVVGGMEYFAKIRSFLDRLAAGKAPVG